MLCLNYVFTMSSIGNCLKLQGAEREVQGEQKRFHLYLYIYTEIGLVC
uniref:Uncharacterized protein n=1 Tax=Anguilla anguilla TaxID=7936 RepID=A0A0E9TT03_ANGAN